MEFHVQGQRDLVDLSKVLKFLVFAFCESQYPPFSMNLKLVL